MNPQGLPSPNTEEAQLDAPAPMNAAAWSAPELPYNEAFENDVMEVLLAPPEPSTEDDDVMDLDLPITHDDLPLPLHDFRRKHASRVPGISLPTPTSDLYGGPAPPDAYLEEQLKQLYRKQNCGSNAELDKHLDAEITALLADLKETMRKREEAVKTNEGIEKELKQLEMEREMQKRVEEKWRQGRRASKVSND